MIGWMKFAAVSLAALACLTGALPGAAALAGEAGGSPQAVLDEYSYWRTFAVFRPVAMAEKADGAEVPAGEPRSDAPPADWAGPGFDDSGWFRGAGPVFAGKDGRYGSADEAMMGVAVICLRGKFSVADPSKVQSLRLSAVYRGGIAVRVNGTEVARGHLAKGELKPETPAEEYPLEAYVGPDGKTPLEASDRKAPDAARQRLDLRLRRLAGVEVPPGLLRKGVNVLAVELHRAPVHPNSKSFKEAYKCRWATLGLNEISLAASPGGAVESNTMRPKGIQVWNEESMSDLHVLDYGDPNETLRPVELVGVRNGSFSGQVAVGSDSPIKGLGAEVSALKSRDGKLIPADRILVRFPQPTMEGEQGGRLFRGAMPSQVQRFDALAEEPPGEVPVHSVKPPKEYSGAPAAPGAVQPVRLTVRVPADAAPGEYEGTLTVRAQGLAATAVPVRLKVIGWTLPAPQDFAAHMGIVQSYETLALHYKVPLWSEEHWRLIDRSFGILGGVGVDELYLPLLMKFHWGKESLVRWVKKDDGSFSHDFSIFERYVDTAMKHLGKPEIVCLYAWDRKYRCWERTSSGMDEKRPREIAKGERFLREGPPKVIVPLLDPRTGEVTEMEGPPNNDEKSVGFWKPVLDGCRERLLKRGIAEQAIVLGVVPDGGPAAEEVDNFHAAAPWGKWVQISHAPGTKFRGAKVKEVPVYYAAGVYGGTPRLSDPAEKRLYGWKPCTSHSTDLFCVFPREGAPYVLRGECCLPRYRTFVESYLMTGLRGVGRIGGEFWPVSLGKDSGSETATLINAYSKNIPNMDLAVYDLLAPGPKGAISTVKLDLLLEGAQEGEARVFLEKALEAKNGSLAAAGDVQGLLDRRQRIIRAYNWGSRPNVMLPGYEGSGWQSRSEELFRAAAAVDAGRAAR